MLDTGRRRELWQAARRLAADSRKSGIHLALVAQNPTWQSIDLGIRRNRTPDHRLPGCPPGAGAAAARLAWGARLRFCRGWLRWPSK